MLIIACKLVKCIETYSYLTVLKPSLFTLKICLRTTTKGPPPRCLPQGPHHHRSTPGNLLMTNKL